MILGASHWTLAKIISKDERVKIRWRRWLRLRLQRHPYMSTNTYTLTISHPSRNYSSKTLMGTGIDLVWMCLRLREELLKRNSCKVFNKKKSVFSCARLGIVYPSRIENIWKLFRKMVFFYFSHSFAVRLLCGEQYAVTIRRDCWTSRTSKRRSRTHIHFLMSIWVLFRCASRHWRKYYYLIERSGDHTKWNGRKNKRLNLVRCLLMSFEKKTFTISSGARKTDIYRTVKA